MACAERRIWQQSGDNGQLALNNCGVVHHLWFDQCAWQLAGGGRGRCGALYYSPMRLIDSLDCTNEFSVNGHRDSGRIGWYYVTRTHTRTNTFSCARTCVDRSPCGAFSLGAALCRSPAPLRPFRVRRIVSLDVSPHSNRSTPTMTMSSTTMTAVEMQLRPVATQQSSLPHIVYIANCSSRIHALFILIRQLLFLRLYTTNNGFVVMVILTFARPFGASLKTIWVALRETLEVSHWKDNRRKCGQN